MQEDAAAETFDRIRRCEQQVFEWSIQTAPLSNSRRVRAPVVRAWAETDQKAVLSGAVDLIGG